MVTSVKIIQDLNKLRTFSQGNRKYELSTVNSFQYAVLFTVNFKLKQCQNNLRFEGAKNRYPKSCSCYFIFTKMPC